MPDYEEAAKEAGWKKKGTRWTHPGYPGKVFGNAREVYNEALPTKFKRPCSADDREHIPEPTVVPDPKAKPVMIEWTPELGPHPDTVQRKTGVRPVYRPDASVDIEVPNKVDVEVPNVVDVPTPKVVITPKRSKKSA